MDDALGLMLYAIMMAIARTLDSGAALSVMTLLVKPLIEIVGSLAMGVLIGTVMVFCLRFFHSRGNQLTMTIAHRVPRRWLEYHARFEQPAGLHDDWRDDG